MSYKAKCPLDTKDSQLLINLGLNQEDKLWVYPFICVVLRLIIATIALKYYEKDWFLKVSGILSILIIITLVRLIISSRNNTDDGEEVWWSRTFHIFIAIQILLSSIHQYKNNTRNKTIPVLLYLDAFGSLIIFLLSYFLVCD
jgi:amino acid permease